MQTDFKSKFILISSIVIHPHRIHFCLSPFHIYMSLHPKSWLQNNLKIFTQHTSEPELLCLHHYKNKL